MTTDLAALGPSTTFYLCKLCLPFDLTEGPVHFGAAGPFYLRLNLMSKVSFRDEALRIVLDISES